MMTDASLKSNAVYNINRAKALKSHMNHSKANKANNKDSLINDLDSNPKHEILICGADQMPKETLYQIIYSAGRFREECQMVNMHNTAEEFMELKRHLYQRLDDSASFDKRKHVIVAHNNTKSSEC